MSKALAAWTELNDRQRGTLAVFYALDQAKEAARREAGARGEWSDTPAAVWRAIDFAHDPSDRRLVGWTDVQLRLESRGWDNQGNGATVAALADRGLLTRDSRPTAFGWMLTVRLTRAGRAAARAGTTTMPDRRVTPALSYRAWEVLAALWAADQRGRVLEWLRSPTIDTVLIGRHQPPLAEAVRRPTGYAITGRGREFYREHYAAHAAAFPDVDAPHPDGPAAEPWPAQADKILSNHRAYYRALCAAWRAADDARRAAEAEASAEPAPLSGPEVLPAAVTALAVARHELWRDTARQRAALAAGHTSELAGRAEQAARGYAVAALAAFRAAALRTDPLAVLEPPGQNGGDERPLTAPPDTGIHAIDAAVRELHAAATGVPPRRRGPAPRRRRAAGEPATPELPGTVLAVLADFLRGHVSGGALTRRLHPVVPATPAPR